MNFAFITLDFIKEIDDYNFMVIFCRHKFIFPNSLIDVTMNPVKFCLYHIIFAFNVSLRFNKFHHNEQVLM